jgi:GAF domain-containing protein
LSGHSLQDAFRSNPLEVCIMSSDRLLSIFEAMAKRERRGCERGSLCAVASEVTGVQGAVIVLANDDSRMTLFCSSNSFSRSLIDLEMTLGEGPCSETLVGDVTATEPDLAAPNAPKWILFAPESIALGARAVFGFPIRIGAIRLGVLCLYAKEPGELSYEQTTQALLMASVVGRGVIALQAGAPPDALSQELQNEATFDFSVHQAAGMVAIQAHMTISNALVSLRARAFSATDRLDNVAAKVIRRELRFDAGLDQWIEVTI